MGLAPPGQKLQPNGHGWCAVSGIGTSGTRRAGRGSGKREVQRVCTRTGGRVRRCGPVAVTGAGQSLFDQLP